MRSVTLVLRILFVVCVLCGAHALNGIRHALTGEYDAKCMDGTPGVYYLYKADSNAKWMVFLEGGGWCFSEGDYNNTYNCKYSSQFLRSSNGQPETQDLTFFNHTDYNIAHIHYCSGDIWSGTKTAPNQHNFTFSGRLIIANTISKLIAEQRMDEASTVVFYGESAGAIGTWVNIAFLQQKLPHANVRVLSDSGWFPESYAPPVVKPNHVASLEQVYKAVYEQSNGALNEECVKANQAKPWLCYSAHYVYPYLKADVFVAQSLYDAFYVGFNRDNILDWNSPGAILYFNTSEVAFRKSLAVVAANPKAGLFISTHLGHEMTEHNFFGPDVLCNNPIAKVINNWLNGTAPMRVTSQCHTVGCNGPCIYT